MSFRGQTAGMPGLAMAVGLGGHSRPPGPWQWGRLGSYPVAWARAAG